MVDRTTKMCTVCGGPCGRGRVNGRDEGEGKWLMGFIYIYDREQ
jgi:hypothetical protein